MQEYVPHGDWSVIKSRPQSGLIEFDGQNYRKSGAGISLEIARQQQLCELDFPVPPLLEVTDEHYVEQALTGRTMIDESPDDPIGTFYTYKPVLERLLRSQISHAVVPDEQSMREGIHFQNVMFENPELDRICGIQLVYDTIVDRAQGMPWTKAHGDLSPTNIFQDGIIDWEFGFDGPAGYDLLSLPASPLLYGPGQKSHIDALLTKELVDSIGSEFGIDNLAQFEPAALFMKAAFYLSHMRQATIEKPHKRELWFRRKNNLRYIADCIASGETPDYAVLQAMSGKYVEGAVARVSDADGRRLVVNYSDSPDSPWHLPGGESDSVEGSTEQPIQTVERELTEELGAAMLQSHKSVDTNEVMAYLLREPYDAADGNRYYGKYKRVVDVIYEGSPVLQPDGNEVRRAKWVTTDELRDLPMLGDEKKIAQAI